MSLLAGRPNPKIPASGERDTKFNIRLIEAPELLEGKGSTFGQKCLPDGGGDLERLPGIWSILVYRYGCRCKQSGYLEPSVS